MAERAPWQKRLTNWYQKNCRDLPWRRSHDPYAVLVSEVMLQQTQVAAVIPYFNRWMARFPTGESLAAASEDDVLALWQGLGYYRRAKFLRKAAIWISQHGVPESIEDWRKVPGVGIYTAAAVGSIAQDLPAAVADGNVERVFARFTANPAEGPSLLSQARNWANTVLDNRAPGEWNQALMELGATVCTPRQPKCDACPIEENCVARQTWSVERFPTPKVAPAVVRQRHLVWVPYFEGKFGLRQIGDGEWWAGLWEFPRAVETQAGAAEEQLRRIVGDPWLEALGSFRHQVTNHRIEIVASLVRCDGERPGLEWRRPSELGARALPTPQRRVLALALTALGYEGDSTLNME